MTADQTSDHGSSSSDSEAEFEFAFITDSGSAVSSADEIFANGQIRPIYPFPARDRRPKLSLQSLLLGADEMENGDELAGVPEETYCLWVLMSSPGWLKKSGSTGMTSSASLRVKLRDMVIGSSSTGGKERFRSIPKKPSSGGGAGRRTFLPYRRGLFGSGTHHHW